MNIKLLFSLGVAVFFGIILIPISCIFAADMLPYSVGASCLGGLLAYIYTVIEQKKSAPALEITKATNELLKASLENMNSQLFSIVQEIKNDRDIREKSIIEFKDLIVENQRNSLDDIKVCVRSVGDDIINEVRNISRSLDHASQNIIDRIDCLKTQETDINNAINNASSQIGKSLESTAKTIQEKLDGYAFASNELITAIKFILENGFATSTELVRKLQTVLENEVKESSDIIKEFTHTFRSHMDKVDVTLGIASGSFDSLSSSISNFMSSHDGILNDLTASNHKVIENQSKLETLVSNQETFCEGLLREVCNSFRLSSDDLIHSVESSNEEIAEMFIDKNDKLCDKIQDVLDSLGDLSKDMNTSINKLNDLIGNQDGKLSAISNYMPEVVKLSKTEEQLMNKLVDVCRQKRK